LYYDYFLIDCHGMGFVKMKSGNGWDQGMDIAALLNGLVQISDGGSVPQATTETAAGEFQQMLNGLQINQLGAPTAQPSPLNGASSSNMPVATEGGSDPLETIVALVLAALQSKGSGGTQKLPTDGLPTANSDEGVQEGEDPSDPNADAPTNVHQKSKAPTYDGTQADPAQALLTILHAALAAHQVHQMKPQPVELEASDQGDSAPSGSTPAPVPLVRQSGGNTTPEELVRTAKAAITPQPTGDGPASTADTLPHPQNESLPNPQELMHTFGESLGSDTSTADRRHTDQSPQSVAALPDFQNSLRSARQDQERPESDSLQEKVHPLSETPRIEPAMVISDMKPGTTLKETADARPPAAQQPAPPILLDPSESRSASSVRFEVNPEDVGRVRVHLTVADHTVYANVVTERAELQDFLLKNHGRLESGLNAHGLDVGRFQVEVQMQGRERADQGPMQWFGGSQGWQSRSGGTADREAGAEPTAAPSWEDRMVNLFA
jgi:hypothetical protein